MSMPLSMYDASVPVFREALGHSSAILQKARQSAARSGMDPAALIHGRLYPDMYPLTQQVRGICVLSMTVSSRLAGASSAPSIDADRADIGFDDYHAWIETALAFLAALDPAAFDGAAERTIVFPLRGTPCHFTGKSFLFRFGLPNFY